MSMGTLAIDFLIMGFAHAIWLLFVGRFLSGLSGATHSTAAAYIADTTEPENRAQAFGMLGAAFGLGFILGPVIGGFLGQIDPRAPFFAAAALAGVNFLYGLFVLPESLAPEHRRKFDWNRANAFGAFRHFSKLPHLAWFMLALGLFNFAHWVYPATFNYFGAIRFGWNAGMIGLALGAVGIGSAVVQVGLIGPSSIALRRDAHGLIFGFLVSCVAPLSPTLAPEGWMVFVIVPFGSLAGVFNPAINQIMTARVERNAQGELQGALASVQALTNISSPLVMTQTLFYFTHADAPLYLPGAAFLLAAVVCALLAVAALLKACGPSKVAEIAGPGRPMRGQDRRPARRGSVRRRDTLIPPLASTGMTDATRTDGTAEDRRPSAPRPLPRPRRRDQRRSRLCLSAFADFEWIDGAAETIAAFNARGWWVFVVTNQSGIARGYYTEDAHADAARLDERRTRRAGAHIDRIYHCPFHEDGTIERYRRDSYDRKPRPGMLIRAMTDFPVIRERSFLIGDKDATWRPHAPPALRGFQFSGGDLASFAEWALADIGRK